MPKTAILYCHCTYAKVIPEEVKTEVLKNLCTSNTAFDAVADLCEMSSNNDPQLKQIAEQGPAKIVACYPRAVKWLFAAAEAPLPGAGIEILNMRTQSAKEVIRSLTGNESPATQDRGQTTNKESELNNGAG